MSIGLVTCSECGVSHSANWCPNKPGNEVVTALTELTARAELAEVEVARLRAVLETLDEYLTTGASHEALRVVVFDALTGRATTSALPKEEP